MSSAAPQPISIEVNPLPATGKCQPDREFRVLFCSWSELNVASGTPVIVCDILPQFGPAEAEVLVEENADQKRRRETELQHPLHKYRLHARLWPFARGHRIRNRLARLGLPVLVGQMVARVRRFKPDCIYAIYAQQHWILAAWVASRLTGVPLIYHIHDAFLEGNERRQRSRFATWLERRALTSTRVLALDDHMAEHYERRYGIQCTILRHIVRHPALPPRINSVGGEPRVVNRSHSPGQSRPITIGFAGAIYDSNSRQLAELCRLVNTDSSLRLKIWTGSAVEFETLGICGPRVESAFEANYERLLAHLAGCDLLYLPLQFSNGTQLAAQAMALSLPTKSFDYALSGVPILVHCPEGFALSRFFERNRCGHVLNDPRLEAVREWIDQWRAGKIPEVDEQARLKTLALFTPEESKRILWGVLGEEVDRVRRSTLRGRSQSK